MQKDKIQLLTFINAAALVLLICFLVFKSFFSDEKVVYVDNIKLFDGFYMTKEMKTLGENEFKNRKTVIDSLYKRLEMSTNDQERKVISQEFVKLKEEFDQFNQNFAIQETEKIWTRMSGYINEFSKENNYDIIIGSENKRDVLFADEKVDITNELISYINKKYEGNK